MVYSVRCWFVENVAKMACFQAMGDFVRVVLQCSISQDGHIVDRSIHPPNGIHIMSMDVAISSQTGYHVQKFPWFFLLKSLRFLLIWNSKGNIASQFFTKHFIVPWSIDAKKINTHIGNFCPKPGLDFHKINARFKTEYTWGGWQIIPQSRTTLAVPHEYSKAQDNYTANV